MTSALSDLRHQRRRRRLGDTEWFDLAYRVYLVAIFGGMGIVIASDQVGDSVLSDSQIADVYRLGPAWIGVVVAIAIAGGLRSGAHGGPVTVESADIQHLLLAPIDRGSVLRRPFWQRLRAVAFASALAGGVAGLLAEQRIPSSAGAWVWWGTVFGAVAAAAVVALATIVHCLRVPPWLAALVGGILIVWQVWAAVEQVRGPFDDIGGIALRADLPATGELVAIAVVIGLTLIAQALVGRLRMEHLARRGGLVSQLRFAVTMQDLRTVVLLRRQLRQERPRQRPWVRLPARRASRTSAPRLATIRRSIHGLLRMPAARFGRLALTAALAGGACGAAVRGTTPALLIAGVLLFVLGLDLIEPLSQEIDHPERTAAINRPSGQLHADLLVGPALASLPLAMIGAAAASIVAPASAPAAFALAVPITLCGIVGGVVNAVRDEFDPSFVASHSYDLVVPPEVSGFSDVFRMALPVIVSSVGLLAVLLVRQRPDAAAVVRALVGMTLWLALVRWWIVNRVELRRKWRGFAASNAMSGIPGALVVVDDLSKHYGDAPALLALDVTIDPGQRVALIGHNGSGKTTLIRLLCGLLDATTGTATVNGHAPGSIPARAALSYLADQPVFYDDLSVIEHLEYVARLHGEDDWRERAEQLAEQVGISDRLDDLPSTFSRGLRQKAAICLAFVRPFRLLVVDEPFVGLDVNGRQALLGLFDEAQQQGRTLLVATHELATVAASERVLALRDGALVYDGPPVDDLDALVDS